MDDHTGSVVHIGQASSRIEAFLESRKYISGGISVDNTQNTAGW